MNMHRFITIVSFLLCLTFVSSTAFADSVVKVTQITPSGEYVPSGRQVVIQFNQDLVPLGDMRRSGDELPISITPALSCQWRWLTTSSLACELDESTSLSMATTYTVTLNKGSLNEEGDSLNDVYEHVFRTAIPSLKREYFDSQFKLGKPSTKLVFDYDVTKSSLEKTVKYQFLGNDGLKQVSAKVWASERYSRPASELKKNAKHSQYWRVQPKTKLPKNTAVKLVILPGMASPQGSLTSEEKQIVTSFHTFGVFEFLGLSCFDLNGREQQQLKGNNLDAKCNPEQGVKLEFSTPMKEHELHGLLSLSNSGRRTEKLQKAWKDDDRWARIHSYHAKGKTYSVYLPAGFIPNKKYSVSQLSLLATRNRPQDLLGQRLQNQIFAEFGTSHYAPAYRVPYSNIVLEQNVNSDVPINTVNIDSLEFTYQLNDNQKRKNTIQLSHKKDTRTVVSAGVRELLNNQSGVISGYFSSAKVSNRWANQKIVAQITPYQVHAKMGHFSSLVWVTDLASGALIANAKVEILKSNNVLASNGVALQGAVKTDQHGVALLRGLSDLDPQKKLNQWCRNNQSCPKLLVRVTKDNYSAILPIDYQYQVSAMSDSGQQFYSSKRPKYGHIQSWGTTAQGIYRRGETIQYKIYLRDQNNTGLIAPPNGKYQLALEDGAGKVVYSLEGITPNKYGSFSGEIKLSESAVMGAHQFIVSSDFSTEKWYPLGVMVTDFTPSPFRLKQTLNGERFQSGDRIVVNANASLHSGGAYTGADAKIEAAIRSVQFSSDHPSTKGFKFSEYADQSNETLFDETRSLNRNGGIELTRTLPSSDNAPTVAEIIIRTAVEDDRGKSVVTNSKARYFGVDRLVGLKNTQWVYKSGQPASVKYLVVNQSGKPVAGTKINIDIAKRVTKVAKIKSAGNAYLPNYQESWVKVASCSEVAKAEASKCVFTPESAGVYRFAAVIKDTLKRTYQVSQKIWVAGDGYVNWQESKTNVLQMVAEKSNFIVGEKARYLVKNPYPGAQALISIERYGVIESWQQTLEGSTPIIEFDIKPEYLPGAYLSVLVTVPRAGNEVPEMGQIDLAKPAYKMGYQKLTVKDPNKGVVFDIQTDSDVYKPGDIVSLTIKPQVLGGSKGQNIELAVSVLDEAVFDLVRGGSGYFDPRNGFNKVDDLDVENYSLLTRLIGLQKFSKKGANPGGGGGESDMRDNMKGVAFFADSIELMVSRNNLEEVVVTASKRVESKNSEVSMESVRDKLSDLAHWQDKIITNDDGSITIKFKLPDNLTAWKVLAIATTPSDQMGLGEHSFKVNQLTEIRPVMPNQVMERDQFNAGFSIHNRSEHARSITVDIQTTGDSDVRDGFQRTLDLPAHGRETIFVPMTAVYSNQSAGVSNVVKDATDSATEYTQAGQINYVVRAYDSFDSDALSHQLTVNKRSNLTSVAVYGSSVGDQVEQPIRLPDDIADDLGGVAVRLTPTIISNLDGAFDYMRDYPYVCWEQKLTKAVMASHYSKLKPYVGQSVKWAGSAEIPQATLDNAVSHQADNGGMAYFVASNHYVSPYLSAYTALAFSWLREEGYQIPIAVQQRLHDYLKSLLRKNTFPNYFSDSMISTVRAVALAALAKNGDLSRTDLMRYVPDTHKMSLFGKAHLLRALQQFEGTQMQQVDLIQALLADSIRSAGKISFNEKNGPVYQRIHSSSARANCAILNSFSAAPELLVDKELPAKLALTVSESRGSRRHWENTQDNVYCLKALGRYASEYESQKPKVIATVSLNSEPLGQATFSDYKDAAKNVKKPMNAAMAGQTANLRIEHEGQGRVYHQVMLQFSQNAKQTERENNGIDVRRELSVFRNNQWRLLKTGEKIHRGETLRTDLFISAPVERNFVAVRDPVAGGLEPINSSLATSATSLKVEGMIQPAKGSHYYTRNDWTTMNRQSFAYVPWGFYHQELGHEAVTFYSDYLAKGQYHLSYNSQAIATGVFSQFPTHAEEMYSPDIFGKSKTNEITIVE